MRITRGRTSERWHAWGALGAVLIVALASGCASSNSPTTCKVRVVGVEKYRIGGQEADLAYRVAGEAGSPAVVSLVAKNGPQSYVTGYGVNVGPGPFEAIVELKLTGAPRELLTMLEVGGRRCTAAVRLGGS
jgi:hypothetical protein